MTDDAKLILKQKNMRLLPIKRKLMLFSLRQQQNGKIGTVIV